MHTEAGLELFRTISTLIYEGMVSINQYMTMKSEAHILTNNRCFPHVKICSYVNPFRQSWDKYNS